MRERTCHEEETYDVYERNFHLKCWEMMETFEIENGILNLS